MTRKRKNSAAASRPSRELRFPVDLRDILRPQRKWHYVFHLVVLVVAVYYWVGSSFTLPEASWRELVMYRPSGDNQIYPAITALSRGNFGDPTDAFHYGEGVAGYQVVVLLPHALAVALFGWPGYMVADAVYLWLYFVGVTWLLRRTGVGALPSLILGSALATGALQQLAKPLSSGLGTLVAKAGLVISEWRFPDLFSLAIYDARIPRPLITELLLVLILGVLIRAWTSDQPLTVRNGICLGTMMSLLTQGDPFSFSTLGLVLVAFVLWRWTRAPRAFPWRFALAFTGSGLVAGGYFLHQMTAQDPEAAIRFGLTEFPRNQWRPLPGFAPPLRVIVVAFLAVILLGVARRSARRAHTKASAGDAISATPANRSNLDPDATGSNGLPRAELSRRVAWFSLCLALAAYLAQPLQLLVMGKGAQIYHYLLFTLPCFYAYAVVLLLLRLAAHLPRPWERLLRSPRWSRFTQWSQTALILFLLGGEAVFGTQSARETIATTKTCRNENTPWAFDLPDYRAGFRALDLAMVQEPALKESRTFATFNHEVNFLLAGFHNKRAYLPDNGFTTQADRELEHRLFEMAKICRLGPGDQFPSFIQNQIILNYWLGCAKYWFSPEHTFAPLTNYTAANLEELATAEEQRAFRLVLPKSELARLVRGYEEVTFSDSDVSTYPDLIILSSYVKSFNIEPNPGFYSPVYTNNAFWVYRRTKDSGLYTASPQDSPTR